MSGRNLPAQPTKSWNRFPISAIHFEIPINERREKVWKAMDNVENMKEWQPSLKSFEHQSGEPGQVGAVSKLTYNENGREIVLTETITGRKEPEEFSGTYDNPVARNRVKNTFVELDRGKFNALA
ncbi:SRPBCC family protein [candidate division KSB1 bacterium]|nr:SRPBCC family protein [candidate division KSB1 bacterium]NIR68740.1 SRPBCC family protein [candidate division KSB1 bacterium]NIS25557.1 SRPBCC family protein [candidate division KSB1 bacterium]NIT72451.1 SRPBCC family protein [candidate division KSB1 bacterium]NIU26234.1 SRPBCC family protein [candidate division KSB1 bacterium]